MKCLSIDTSSTCIGWALWNDDKLLQCGKIKPTDENAHWRERIKSLLPQLDKIIKDNKPKKVYCEDVPLMIKGGKSTLVVLGAVQGSILGLCASNDIIIEFISVSHWRSRIGLYNGTEKGKERDNLKVASINLANELFNADLKCVLTKTGRYNEKKSDDDIADSILLYASNFDKYCNRKRGKFGRKGDK